MTTLTMSSGQMSHRYRWKATESTAAGRLAKGHATNPGESMPAMDMHHCMKSSIYSVFTNTQICSKYSGLHLLRCLHKRKCIANIRTSLHRFTTTFAHGANKYCICVTFTPHLSGQQIHTITFTSYLQCKCDVSKCSNSQYTLYE